MIIYELQIPEDYFSDTRYYYNYIDLNQDGVEEMIALAVGYFTSGSGGSSAVICTQVDGGVRLLQALTMMNPPFIISEETTNGYRDIIMLHNNKYVKLTFDGETYTRVTDAEVLESLEGIVGEAIICDSIEQNEDAFIRYLK